MVLSLLISLVSTAGEVTLPGAAEQERFKAYFTQGEALYQQGEYGAAIWNFRQADSIRITPEVAFDLAKCHEKIGDVAFSTFYYRQYLKRDPNAKDALDVAERVGTVLAKAEGEGRGLLEVISPGAIELAVNNGRFAEAPVAMFLPPGEYELSATFPSGVKKMVTQIRTGKTTPIAFEPMPPPLLDASSAEVIVTDGTHRPSKPINKIRLLGIGVSVLGAAGLGVGIPFGLMNQEAAQRCCSTMPDKTLSPAQKMELAQQANLYGGIANAGIIAGSVLLGVGVALIVLSLLGVGG